jgi:RNA polymerase sigma factor (sigma-70 family)
MSTIILNDPNEKDLVQAAVEDLENFAPLYHRYAGRVYAFLRYLGSDPRAARELAAHTFERALSRLSSYNPKRGSFCVWLFEISQDAFRDQRRSTRLKRWLLLANRPLEASPGSLDGSVEEEIALQAYPNPQILSALETLSAKERLVLGLKFAGGLTNKEIAASSGLDEDKAALILYRAVRRLQQDLGQAGM